MIPHEVLGLILYLNFKKIMEDIAEQKARKIVSRFSLVYIFLIKKVIRLVDCMIKGKGLSHNRPSRWPKGVRVG